MPYGPDEPIKSMYMPSDPKIKRAIGDRNRALAEAQRAERLIAYAESHPGADINVPAAVEHAITMRAEVAEADNYLNARHYDPTSRKDTDADLSKPPRERGIWQE